MSTPETVEVWKNSANGPRWFTKFDVQGRESDKVIPGGRTFSLTTFERQVTQEKAASADLDLFRNGTFILVKPANDTNEQEFESTQSVTDSQLTELALEIKAEPDKLEQVLEGFTSPITIYRFMEQLVAEDAPDRVIKKVKEAFEVADGGTVATRRRVIGAE